MGSLDQGSHILGVVPSPGKVKKTPGLSHEPRKKHRPYFPLNPVCLMTGSLFHGL